VAKALDLGITLFDTADAYGNKGGSETMLGKALGTRRKDIVLATKFGLPMGEGDLMKGASRRYTVNAVEASLKRLNTDYIDLYQIHFPDPETPIDETLAALDDLIEAGKVRYIGSSNFAGWQLADAWYIAKELGTAKFVSAQNHYNLLDRKIEQELIPAAKAYGASVLPYFPLASGMLTGKYKRDQALPNDGRLTAWGDRGKAILSEQNFDLVEKLAAFAQARGRTLLDLAFGWLASQSQVASVIAGATKPEQVEQNVKAGEWELNADELAEVGKLSFRF
jgi:aryl-alcohol dehydrogenase-like predicted oxidoreductase